MAIDNRAEAKDGGGSVVFSFRANADDAARWRAYAKAKAGESMASVGAAAMEEYMERHRLTMAEAEIYGLELATTLLSR